MAKLYDKKSLGVYLKNDTVLTVLRKYPKDEVFASHKWLLNMPPKRMIYADVYGSFLRGKGKKLLDVGGGFCGLTRELIKRHEYTLLDIMTHEDRESFTALSRDNGDFWTDSDWHDFTPLKRYDCIIANDIFPNVDQRLESFVKKFKPHADKIIITLTCYDEDQHYQVKRLDTDEVLTVVPWSSRMTEMALNNGVLEQNIRLPVPSHGPSLFRNGRTVYRLDL